VDIYPRERRGIARPKGNADVDRVQPSLPGLAEFFVWLSNPGLGSAKGAEPSWAKFKAFPFGTQEAARQKLKREVQGHLEKARTAQGMLNYAQLPGGWTGVRALKAHTS
jgi:hypothetical protein